MRVTFCIRSLATQGGSVNTRNVATERLAKSDKLSENVSFRKIDRQLGFRSHNLRSLSMRLFEDADGNRKWAVFTLNLPSHNHIHIAKYLFSVRDE